MPHQTSFACPHCAAAVPTGASDCLQCGLRLTGPEAHRLWEVDQQIASLVAERGHLISALIRGDASTALVTPPLRVDGAVSVHKPASVYARATTPRKALSGQQLLLGLGALLLLSAASFFLLVVWLVVGLAGQAVIMVTLTGAAVLGSRWATRRGLPAVAETAAVLATGLLAIDLSAAHSLGLAGLDVVPWSHYWTGASLLGGALLLGWDRLIPRQHHDGRSLRRILTYRPAAAALLATTPWFLLAAVDPAPVWLPAALGLVAFSNLAYAELALRLDTAPAELAPAEGARAPIAVSAGIFLLVAALAVAGYAATGLALGYDLSAPQGQRYTAFAVLLVAPLLLAWASTHLTRRALPDAVTSALPAVATLWAAAALGIPLVDATYPVLVALAAVAAVVATGLHLRRRMSGSLLTAAWLRAGAAFAFIAQPVLLALVLVVTHSGHNSLHAAQSVDVFAATGLDMPEPSPVWSVLAAAVWALSAAVGTASRRSGGWAFVAHLATLVALLAALEDASARTAWVVLLGAFAVITALACLSARRTASIAIPASRTGVDSPDTPEATDATNAADIMAPPPTGSLFWAGVERATVAFGVLYALGGLVAAASSSSAHVSASFIGVGVLTIVYAASPGRLPFAYVGSLAISAGIANLMNEASVTTIEAYTAPLVALLAAIGYVQWTRNPHAPTRLTMGPALAVTFGPSLLTSLDEGDELRLVVVTTAAIAVLLVGLARHWKAPVTVGTLTLVVVALTQGGPLTSYVPGWVTLGAAGAALLAAGIAWEKAVLAGRRATTWYSTLV